MNIINAFTGLRGLSCLAVIASHWYNDTVGIVSFSAAGGMAVAFFFVLSGYLLVKREFESMQRTPDTQPERFFGTRAIYFFIRRFLRIYPAYVAVCFIYKYGYVRMCEEKGFMDEIVANFTRSLWILVSMKDNHSHLWTMASEFFFSVGFLPAFLSICSELMILDYKFLRKSPIRMTIIFFILLHFLFDAQVAVIKFFESPLGMGSPLNGMYKPFWYGCLGGAASFYINHLGYNPKIQGGYKRLAAEIATYAILIRIYLADKVVALMWNFPTMDSEFDLAPWYALLLLVIEFSASVNSFANLVGTEIITHIGEISYSTYLIHLFFMKFVVLYTSFRGIDGLAVNAVITLVAGQILYTLVERTSIKVTSIIIKKLKNSEKLIKEKIQISKQSKFAQMDEEPETAKTGNSQHIELEVEATKAGTPPNN